MIYSEHDTDWATSAKGNKWRRIAGYVLVVGKAKSGSHYWAMVDGEFLDGYFEAEAEAKEACERESGDLLDRRGC